MKLSGADFYLQRLKRVRCVISIASASASALSRGCSQVQISQHSTELIIDLSVMATTLELARQIETKLKLQDSQLVRQLATVSDSLEQARQYAGLPDASGNR